ncbi:MAG: sulfur carrier protein ThiS [Chloroflexi bacterium]|nr:sulfur carrier protein ThiS [Chloroflexota bacterium]
MILVNQRDELPWRHDMTVADVIQEMRFTHPHIVVSVNGCVVPESDFVDHRVPDGADVRVIHLMAGG